MDHPVYNTWWLQINFTILKLQTSTKPLKKSKSVNVPIYLVYTVSLNNWNKFYTYTPFKKGKTLEIKNTIVFSYQMGHSVYIVIKN